MDDKQMAENMARTVQDLHEAFMAAFLQYKIAEWNREKCPYETNRKNNNPYNET